MNDLVTMAGSAPPPRPLCLPAEGKLAIARAIATDLVNQSLVPARDADEAAGEIARHAEPFLDGYQIGRRLDERAGWDCTMEIAEALDAFAHLHHEALEAVQKAWVERHGIRPPLPDGARVIARVGGERRAGVIRGVYEHGAAKYLVRDAAEPEDTTRSWVVPFEHVEADAAAEPVAELGVDQVSTSGS